MAYYKGKNLTARLTAYGLLAFAERLEEVEAKEGVFQALVVTTPEQLSNVRLTLYSLFSSLGLSEVFSLSVDKENSTITIKKKLPPRICVVSINTDDMPEG